ncbi:MAG: gamma-glutamyltransferase, partial [Melioribacteraceae bacterium]
ALSEALNILENFSFEKDEWNSGRYVHTVSEILKYVYADRSEHLGDEQFFNVPRKNMLSKEYAETIAGKIHNHATPSIDISPSDFTYYESDETTHYNVFDSRGNAVSVTYTLNSLFGNKIIVEGAGFFMNNQMDDFSSQPGMPNQYGLIGSEANSIQPGKRMLSSMTPVIVLRNNKPYLLLGGRGGSKIITSVMQTFINVVEFGMNIKKAIEVPRFHHQWYPDRIDYNEFALSKDVKENLISRGQNIGVVEGLAKVTGILIDDNGIMWGAYDPRGEGKAIGY